MTAALFDSLESTKEGEEEKWMCRGARPDA